MGPESTFAKASFPLTSSAKPPRGRRFERVETGGIPNRGRQKTLVGTRSSFPRGDEARLVVPVSRGPFPRNPLGAL